MGGHTGIEARFAVLHSLLDERSRRLLAAAESQVIGRGGISVVSRATGVSRQVIRRGMAELKAPATVLPGHIRRAGGGRKKIVDQDRSLKSDLESLLESTTRGDPEAPLRWTCRSVRNLTAELQRLNHTVSHQVVAELLHELDYSLQANRKTRDGSSGPQRAVRAHQRKGSAVLGAAQPVISVDTKKKELVGDFKNGGQEWMPKGKPKQVRVHDFVIPELGRAAPYGVYDLGLNTGWVSVGVDHDTAQFAVERIRRWWHAMGKERYPQAPRAPDHRRWRRQQRISPPVVEAGVAGLGRRIGHRGRCHFPPGTSKWNKIEHRLFSFISKNWRGQPLTSFKVIVSLIAGTTTGPD